LTFWGRVDDLDPIGITTVVVITITIVIVGCLSLALDSRPGLSAISSLTSQKLAHFVRRELFDEAILKRNGSRTPRDDHFGLEVA
jgi:hypothetical protein